MIHILIIDNDENIRRVLRRYLEGEGYRVSDAACLQPIEFGWVARPDFRMLDLVLGGVDGPMIVPFIRRFSNVPIIIVSSKGDLIDRVIGLESGADDYISKPFHLREVLARVRSVLRRSRMAGSQHAQSGPCAESIVPRLRVNIDCRTVQGIDGMIDLTSGEFDLFAMFISSPHRVLNRNQIMDRLNGIDWTPNDRSIDNQIARLRKKIEIDPSHPALIKTVRGIGYTFEPAGIAVFPQGDAGRAGW